MDNKQLKKVFEFIATMLDGETQESPTKMVTQSTESPVSEDSVGEDYDIPNSFSKLSKKHNLDINHIRELIKTIEAETAKKVNKNRKDSEVYMLKQEIKKIKEDYEDKLRDGAKQVERVTVPLERSQTYESPIEVKGGKLTYVYESETQPTPIPEPPTNTTE